jgi:hypothetical protein
VPLGVEVDGDTHRLERPRPFAGLACELRGLRPKVWSASRSDPWLTLDNLRSASLAEGSSSGLEDLSKRLHKADGT